MIFFEDGIWEPCTKEKFEKSMKNHFWSRLIYRRVPIYEQGCGGIMDQINWREPIGYRYEKLIGTKQCVALSSKELKDKKVMKILKEKGFII